MDDENAKRRLKH